MADALSCDDRACVIQFRVSIHVVAGFVQSVVLLHLGKYCLLMRVCQNKMHFDFFFFVFFFFFFFFFFSGLHHYECVAPLVANSLQSGRFWARSTASVHDSPWESRSFCTVFIQVIRGRPGGLFQYTEGEEFKICFASTLSSIRAICPNRVKRRAWIISMSIDWLVRRRTSSLVIPLDHKRRHH